jgi:3-oxoacyl-[acyl-carrier protein] reductase
VDATAEDWDRLLAVDLRGPFLMTRAVAPHMIAAGWGRVVSLSSVSALGDAGRVGYASAKAGLIGFTRTLAVELGSHGITVNAIAPGFVSTGMTARTARRLGREVAEHERIAADSIPVGRVGRPEDVAHAASYLVSAGAGFVSGQVLFAAGGPVG